jgi:hypothetical protein
MMTKVNFTRHCTMWVVVEDDTDILVDGFRVSRKEAEAAKKAIKYMPPWGTPRKLSVIKVQVVEVRKGGKISFREPARVGRVRGIERTII